MYVHHRIRCRPLAWSAVAARLADTGRRNLEASGGGLYGIWRPQIGRPRDELTAITVWPAGSVAASDAATALNSRQHDITDIVSEAMQPTVRPATPLPPRRQGNFAFRWFETPAEHWAEFLELCEGAWPDFESSYDSQIIGLWRLVPDTPASVRSLLITRRPSLAMWERSKIRENEVEAEVRRKLSRRYDLCTDTVVYTTTLLTAEDRQDTARWT
jgi:hypothetical protein